MEAQIERLQLICFFLFLNTDKEKKVQLACKKKAEKTKYLDEKGSNVIQYGAVSTDQKRC